MRRILSFGSLLLATVASLAGASPAASVPAEVAEVTLGASPVLAGGRVIWVENEGDCSAESVAGSCRQALVAWSRGRRRVLHRFSPPRQARPNGQQSDYIVADLAASGSRVAYLRQAFEEFRGAEVVAEEVGTIAVGGRARQLRHCASFSKCDFDAATVTVSGNRVGWGTRVRRRSGILVFDLSPRAKRRQRFIRTGRFSLDDTRAAGRWIAGSLPSPGLEVAVYDTISGRRHTFEAEQNLFDFALQSDGKLAVAGEGGFDRTPPLLGWVSSGGTLHRLRHRPVATVELARNRIAFGKGRGRVREGRRGADEFVVVDLRGRIRHVEKTRRVPGASPRLAGFDGDCLLWTEGSRAGRELTRIVIAPTRVAAHPPKTCG